MIVNNSNPTTLDIANAPALRCPSCGQPMKSDLQYGVGGDYWLVTCMTSQVECPIGEATASAARILNGEFVERWNTGVEKANRVLGTNKPYAIVRFDVSTGEAL